MPLMSKLRVGQKTMTNSQPVTVASDQTAVPISAASLPLPTGAATSANQVTANGYLTTIASAVGAPGAALPADVNLEGGVGSTTLPASVAEGTTVRAWYSIDGRAHTQSDPGYNFVAVTTNDGANLPTVPTRALYIGVGGDIVVDSAVATAITFKNVPPGTMLPIAVYRVRATSTTASSIVAIY